MSPAHFPSLRRGYRARTGSTILAGVLLVLGAAQVVASSGGPISSYGAKA